MLITAKTIIFMFIFIVMRYCSEFVCVSVVFAHTSPLIWCKAHRIRFEFQKGKADHTFMRIDGEPWKQPLPANESVMVEISHLGQVNMLATHSCISRSVNDPSTPSRIDEDSEEEDCEDDSTKGGEEFRKFGAAATFKMPDEVDISQLS